MNKPNKVVYIVLALVLGGFGVHEFYRGRTAAGFMKLMFCWTLIPAFVAAFQAFFAIFNTRDFS
jgi:TM2 domain-containing membrane protein YozV